MTCMTPRALAEETAELLKPLSCQATADASEPGTPCCAAIWPISDELVWPAVGVGDASGTVVGSGCGPDATGDPAGSFSAVPSITCESVETPFIAASASTGTPALAAMPVRVSPGL